MTKQELINSTIIVLTADGKFKIFDYEDLPQLKSTINQPDMEVKAEPAIAAEIEKQSQRISEKYPPLFIETEDGILIRSKKHGLVALEDWDSLHFDGALQGYARFLLKGKELNLGDLNIINDILIGKLPR